MSLRIRKILIIGLIAAILFAGKVVIFANWLIDNGIPEKADWIKENFLTGTSITIIVALLILMVNPKSGRAVAFGRRCPVCNERLSGKVNYCSDCGSKV